jgi:hypothetical protein
VIVASAAARLEATYEDPDSMPGGSDSLALIVASAAARLEATYEERCG